MSKKLVRAIASGKVPLTKALIVVIKIWQLTH